MAIINSFAFVIGNMTADPTRGVTNNGINVVTFSVAVNNYRKESKDTNYYTCSAYGETGETCMRKLHKGSRVFVLGEQEAKLGTTRNGDTKMYLNLRVLTIRDLTYNAEKTVTDQQPEVPDMTATEMNPDTWEDLKSDSIPW